MAFVCKMTDTSGVTGPVASGIYGTCTTAGGTKLKVVTCADLDKLIVGCVIYVKFDNANSVADTELNVNSLGSKKVLAYETTGVADNATGSWRAGEVVGFMYDEITSGSTTTGYWRMVDTHAGFTTGSVGSASAGTAFSIPNPSATDVTIPNVTAATDVTASKATSGTAISVPTWSFSDVTASKVTLGAAFSVPNVTENTSVTIPNVTSVTAANVGVISATISDAVLTFSLDPDDAASKVILGSDLTASKVTLGTAFSIPNVTAATDVTASKATSGTAISVPTWSFSDVTASKVTLGTALTASKVTFGTAFSVPNISVSSKTVVVPR